MLKPAACLALVMWAASPALACTDAQLQAVADRFFDVSAPGQTSSVVAEGLRRDLAVCASEPAAHKIAALALSAIAQREAANGPAAMNYAEEAMREVLILQASMGKDPKIRNVRNQNGLLTPIRFDDSYDVSKRAIHLLLGLEGPAGRMFRFDALTKAGDPPLKCDVYAGSMGQQAAFFMKEQNKFTPGGKAFLDGILSACAPADYNGLSIRGYRIDLMLSLVDAAPVGPAAIAWLDQAQADSATIFAQRPDGLHIGWKASDLPRLERSTWKVVSSNAVTMPMTEWFKPQNVGKPKTAAIIASELDLAYAKDLAPGGVTAFPLYRGVLTPAFAAAKLLPEPQAREARKMLHRAAVQHAEGFWRRDANKALKKPAAYLYNWIDPDYVAKPTP